MLKVLGALAALLMPLPALADILNGPIVPQCTGVFNVSAACNFCDLIKLANNLFSFAVEFAVVVATLMFVYAGILYFTASARQENIKKAHGIFSKVFIGLILVMTAWLIVDVISKTLVGSSELGPWQDIECQGVAVVTTSRPQQPSRPASPAPRTPRGFTGVQCAATNSACSVTALQAAGFNSRQANAMSCIAMTESSGNPNTPNSSTGACGTFQIIRGNWNNPNLHRGSCSTRTSCNDPACNMQTALILAQNRMRSGQSAYSDWTCPGCNARAQACVDRYDPGG